MEHTYTAAYARIAKGALSDAILKPAHAAATTLAEGTPKKTAYDCETVDCKTIRYLPRGI